MRPAVRTPATLASRSEPLEVFTRTQRSTPARVVGLVVRLRAEVIVAIATVETWLWLVARMAVWMAALLLVVVALVVGCWGPARRCVVRRGYAVMTRHRLRKTFVERRVMNHSGGVPLLLWARPIPTGERVWLLLRAGIDSGDVERALSYIGSACWGADARLDTSRRIAALITVDVIRRDPLASATSSPLRRLRLVPSADADEPVGGEQSA